MCAVVDDRTGNDVSGASVKVNRNTLYRVGYMWVFTIKRRGFEELNALPNELLEEDALGWYKVNHFFPVLYSKKSSEGGTERPLEPSEGFRFQRVLVGESVTTGSCVIAGTNCITRQTDLVKPTSPLRAFSIHYTDVD